MWIHPQLQPSDENKSQGAPCNPLFLFYQKPILTVKHGPPNVSNYDKHTHMQSKFLARRQFVPPRSQVVQVAKMKVCTEKNIENT